MPETPQQANCSQSEFSSVRRTIEPLGPDFQVIGYGHLASRPIHWPDLRQEAPE